LIAPRLPLGSVLRSERRHHFIPGDLHQYFRVLGQLFLFSGALVGRHGQGVLVLLLQRRVLGGANFGPIGGFEVGNLLLQRGRLDVNGVGLLFLPVGFLFGGQVYVPILGSGKKRLQPVVISLRQRVEFVIVATGARHGDAENRRTQTVNHFRQHFLPVFFGIRVAADHVHWAAAMQAGGNPILGRRLQFSPLRQQIAGNLLNQEAIIRFVFIETSYHVVAIAPSMRSFAVGFVTVGLGITNHIEPVLRPALAILRASEQALHQPLVGIRPRGR